MRNLHDKEDDAADDEQKAIDFLQNKWVYFCDRDGLYKVRIGGEDKQKLSDDMCNNINEAGGWIYYGNESDGGKLYRIRVDGSGRKKLSNYKVKDLKIIDKWVYYSLDKGYDRLNVILNDPLYNHRLPSDGEWHDSRRYVIHRMRAKGHLRRWVSYGSDFYFEEKDGYVYCWRYDRLGNLHRHKRRVKGWGLPKYADPPGLEVHTILSPCTVGEWIYYLSPGWRSLNFRELKTDHLWRMREDHSEKTKISSNDFSLLDAGSKLAFYSITHTKWYRGTEFEERTEYFLMHLTDLSSEFLYQTTHSDDWWDYYVDYQDYS